MISSEVFRAESLLLQREASYSRDFRLSFRRADSRIQLESLDPCHTSSFYVRRGASVKPQFADIPARTINLRKFAKTWVPAYLSTAKLPRLCESDMQ